MFTFFPIYDLALFELKLSISPFLILVSDFAPALLAYRKVFAFYLDIKFDVFAFTAVFPRVFTMRHGFVLWVALWRFAFKALDEKTFWWRGGVT
jgi:hypothetical protein